MRAQSITAPLPCPAPGDGVVGRLEIVRGHLRHRYAYPAWALGFRSFEFFDLTPVRHRLNDALLDRVCGRAVVEILRVVRQQTVVGETLHTSHTNLLVWDHVGHGPLNRDSL